METLSQPSQTQVRHNLPLQATPLVGREPHTQHIRHTLKHDDVPLLTLTGPGGMGKTRLALQVAKEMLNDFADGVYFVPLATVVDTPTLVASVVQALGLPGEQKLDQLKTYLKPRNMLLVLDNFEQLIASAEVVAELIANAPHLKIVVTSREGLHITGEHQYPLPPLTLPASNAKVSSQELGHYEAIRLFVQRAKAVKPDFALTKANAPAVVELCRQLDGLALAIELAAARIKLMSPQALLGRMDERLKFLTGGPKDSPERHQTLRATLDWSFNLLSDEEKQLFARMGVFAGGASLEAIEAVCGEVEVFEQLSSLVEKSLIVAGEEAEPRFGMLETIREYAVEKLEASPELGVLRERHARYFLKLAEASVAGLAGSGQPVLNKQLGPEQDNFRITLTWCLQGEVELGQRLAVALHPFWEIRGYFAEGRRWLEALLNAPGESPAPLRGTLFHAAANLARQQGDLEQAHSLAQQALQIRRGVGDTLPITQSLRILATIAAQHCDHQAAVAALEEALLLQRKLGDPVEMAGLLNNLGVMSQRLGQLQQARQYYQEALGLARATGNGYGLSFITCNLAIVLHLQGDLLGALEPLDEALAAAQKINAHRPMGEALLCRGHLEQDRQNYPLAQSYFEQALATHRETGARFEAAMALGRLGMLWVDAGRLEQAQPALDQALVELRSLDFKLGVSHVLWAVAKVYGLKGDQKTADRIHREALALARAVGSRELIAANLLGLALLAQQGGEQGTAFDLLAEGLPQARVTYMRLTAAYLEAIAGIWAERGQYSQAAQLFGAVQALRQTIHTPIALVDRARYERDIAKVRDGLEQDSFNAAWNHGRAMGLDEAISFALGQASALAKTKSGVIDLTARELEVLQLLAQGHSTKKIASQLDISFHTANAHVRSIMSKLGVSTRSAATRKALELKLV